MRGKNRDLEEKVTDNYNTIASKELEIILNYDHENPPVLYENEKEKTSLSRLKLAIRYKQKKVFRLK